MPDKTPESRTSIEAEATIAREQFFIGFAALLDEFGVSDKRRAGYKTGRFEDRARNIIGRFVMCNSQPVQAMIFTARERDETFGIVSSKRRFLVQAAGDLVVSRDINPANAELNLRESFQPDMFAPALGSDALAFGVAVDRTVAVRFENLSHRVHVFPPVGALLDRFRR